MMESPYERRRVDIHVRCCFVSDATFKRCQRFEEQNGRFERVSQTGNGRLPAANGHRCGRVPGQCPMCGNQGSYREPKVLNVLEFYDFIRVPLNVLEFVLNVLECS